MKCAECKYRNTERTYDMCEITHTILNHKKFKPITGCNNIESDADVEKMNICHNCKHWIGFGDWGLSCRANPYYASSDGFHEACEKYERKDGTEEQNY